MIPDKIYVREYPDGINQFWDRKKRDGAVATIHHEYICKDVLLELLREKRKSITECSATKERKVSALTVIDFLINEIESL